MKNQKCNVFLEYKGYTRGLLDVAGLESLGINARYGYRDSLESVLGLIEMILSSRQPKGVEEGIIRLHEEMSRYREHIWNLIRAPDVEAEGI
jgi:hypothetical protein